MKQWLHDMTEDLNSYNELDSNGQLISFADLETHNQLRAGVKTRLQLMSPYVEKWPEAMALGLKHPNAIPTGVMLHNISD